MDGYSVLLNIESETRALLSLIQKMAESRGLWKNGVNYTPSIGRHTAGRINQRTAEQSSTCTMC